MRFWLSRLDQRGRRTGAGFAASGLSAMLVIGFALAMAAAIAGRVLSQCEEAHQFLRKEASQGRELTPS